jgi:signal peptidase I
MEPAFQRGDILFLNNQDTPIRVGEIVVFKIKDRDIPIVHRVLEVHEKYVTLYMSLDLDTRTCLTNRFLVSL